MIIPTSLLHLLILLSVCSLKSNLESKINAKCFWLLMSCTLMSLNTNEGKLSLSHLWEKTYPYGLLTKVRIKQHLSMECPFTYFIQIVIVLSIRKRFVFNLKKRIFYIFILYLYSNIFHIEKANIIIAYSNIIL